VAAWGMARKGRDVVLETRLPFPRRQGKVRDIYEVGDDLLLVASDRMSAFDVVLPNGIPDKGITLTQLSNFWFRKMADVVENHLLATRVEDMPPALSPHRELIRHRSVLVERVRPLKVECIVRGYLIGSGWKDYQRTGQVCGIPLPKGLKQAEELPEPIFTPSTKAERGEHDENISFAEAAQIESAEAMATVRDIAIEVYTRAHTHARERGIILADTKLEFGMRHNREIILIDECLTPDSSRFWPADEYQTGTSPPSYDKQYVRDYLETLDWDKRPPGPRLPDHVVLGTAARYKEAFRRLTGAELESVLEPGGGSK
jgi:phosphoribosylaminoimidazole-succinocarboxamide synthase